jgi:HAD superfamily hydrolase (TIGR01509 family)
MLGVLFDLDGVLLDSEELHFLAYNAVLARFGVQVDRREYALHWICEGHGPEYAVARYSLPLSAAELRAAKAPLYTSLLEREARLMPGVQEVLERLAGEVRLGIATNSGRHDVEQILQRFALARHFSVVVTREDYERAKPAPDAYRVALERLGLPASRVLVVEDSPRGARAALANGLAVVAIPNEFTRHCAFPPQVPLLPALTVLSPAWLRSQLGLAPKPVSPEGGSGVP